MLPGVFAAGIFKLEIRVCAHGVTLTFRAAVLEITAEENASGGRPALAYPVRYSVAGIDANQVSTHV